MSVHPKDMLFTSESVAEGHLDKFCDQISDAVLDECLRLDPKALGISIPLPLLARADEVIE